jgi:hypothetical protein
LLLRYLEGVLPAGTQGQATGTHGGTGEADAEDHRQDTEAATGDRQGVTRTGGD